MEIEADKWTTDYEKKVFMENVEKMVSKGLSKMKVPDWKVTITDVKEKEE